MFDHVDIRAADRPASEAFYDIVLPVVGVEKTYSGDDFAEWGDYSVVAASSEIPPTQRLHIAFFTPEREEVDAFWQAGTQAGYRSDGEPGIRPRYSPDYYGAFLLDPDGNSVEAVSHDSVNKRGVIDHIWMRVADVSAALDFYAAIAAYTGFSLVDDERPALARFRAQSGASFSLVRGTPSERIHVAFPAATRDVVDEFHRAATTGGYRDNGGPGERPVYHEGYYGAFVLDPDGNNVELVDHGR
ncbi:MAG TPA: VOC family protein [Gaiellaceae bacterium]|jgi:catechol 2,3-dioxygenase-like lactoylglutathione lyase family enzyme